MAIASFDQLMDCAMKIATSDEYDGILESFDDDFTCLFEVKIRDEHWDYLDDRVSVKTVALLSKVCEDLINLLRIDIPSISTIEDLMGYFENELTFKIENGCICFKTGLRDTLELVFLSFHELLSEDFEKWKSEVCASLTAFSIAMSGVANWYSLSTLLIAKRKYSEDRATLSVLKYAQKLLLKTQNTPDFLVRTLSYGATVQINREPEITALKLNEIKYVPEDEKPIEFVIDDRFRLSTFSASSVLAQKGSFSRSLKLDKLKPKDRERMGRLADEVVKDKKNIIQALQVRAIFEGEHCKRAWVEGFGPKRPDAISVEGLFANPEIYSKKGIAVRPKKNQQEQQSLLDPEDNN